MATQEKKTYFGMPNNHYLPDHLVNLGQIISDWSAPWDYICKPLQPRPEATHFIDHNYEQVIAQDDKKEIGFSLGLLARLFGISLSRGGSTVLKFRELETQRIDPTEYIDDSMRVPAVQDFLRNNPNVKRLYMVTAIRIGRGAESTSKGSKVLQGDASVGFNIPCFGDAFGLKSSCRRRMGIEHSSGNSSDFIFAYGLRQIFIDPKTGQISSKDYTKNAVYEKEGLQQDFSPEDSVLEGKARGTAEFSYFVDEDDFGATLLPPRCVVVKVVDETGEMGDLVLRYS